MSKIIHVSPTRLVTDPTLNPRFAHERDPAKAARLFYESDAYKGLRESFKVSGITIPLFVEKRNGTGYTVLEGFSRARWAKSEAQKNPALKIPVIVLEGAKNTRTAAVAMNTARVAYDPIARAGSFAALTDEWGSVEQAAKHAGVSPGAVREALRLLKLPVKAQRLIQSGKLSVANANQIMLLKGWRTWRQSEDGKTLDKAGQREARDFRDRLNGILDTIKSMDNVPDVASAWNKGRKSKSTKMDDIAVVVPTVDSLRDACLMYGRKMARVYIKEGVNPDNAARMLRYRTALKHLAASMGWCVPSEISSVLRDKNGNPLYPEAVAASLCREVINEFVLAGVIELARREKRKFEPNDELLLDANWQNFFRQDISLETLVTKLNRRLK